MRSRDVRSNVRRSIKEGIVVDEVHEISDSDKAAVEQGIHDWKKKRTGIQIATQDLQPWVDLNHRRLFYARHGDSRKVGRSSTCLYRSNAHPRYGDSPFYRKFHQVVIKSNTR